MPNQNANNGPDTGMKNHLNNFMPMFVVCRNKVLNNKYL